MDVNTVKRKRKHVRTRESRREEKMGIHLMKKYKKEHY